MRRKSLGSIPPLLEPFRATILTDKSLSGRDAQNVQNLYALYLDWNLRKDTGLAALKKILAPVQNIKTMEELRAYLASKDCVYYGTTFCSFDAGADISNPMRSATNVFSTSLTLGDAAEYKALTQNGKNTKEFCDAVSLHVLLKLGYGEAEAKQIIERKYKFEGALASSMMTTEDENSPDYYKKALNKKTVAELGALSPNFPLVQIMKTRGMDKARRIYLFEPEWLKRLNELFVPENLEILKAYIIDHIARDTANLLDKDTYDFYKAASRKRMGITEAQSLEQDACDFVADAVSVPLSKLYAKNCVDKNAKPRVTKLIKETIAARFQDQDFINPPQIDGRVKSIYSIYRKIFIGHKDIDEIYDKYAVRIIVTTIAECYNVLGLIHDMFKPLPNRFKDYISTPKNNMYQSLHTTVLGKEGIPFEVQIRTWDMHETAEYHWKYKEGIQGKDKMEQRLAWVRQVIEAQQTSDDVEEIVRIIKTDLDPEDIVIMTPKGMSVSLPINSTVIDFAYRIHTEIGHKTVGAKVDGRIVPLDYKLQTGQICEIITSKDPEKGPNRAWLNIVQTNEARSKIRSWFKKERREENIVEGKAQLEREFKRHRINLKEEQYTEFLQDDFKRHNCETLDDFYASIGYGGILLSKMIPRLKDKYEKLYEKEDEPSVIPLIKPKPNGRSSIILDQIDDMLIKFAQCCNPLPGDDIIGFITRGYGVSVHTTNCTTPQTVPTTRRLLPETIPRSSTAG